jgi:ATP-dependent RNA helicase RhlE
VGEKAEPIVLGRRMTIGAGAGNGRGGRPGGGGGRSGGGRGVSRPSQPAPRGPGGPAPRGPAAGSRGPRR